MERVGEHPVPAGPLAVRWLAVGIGRIRAGAVTTVDVELENAGLASWRSTDEGGIWLGYHWLDGRGNAIVWDGLRTRFERPVAPGERVALRTDVRGAVPPGRYRLALDLVDEGRFWLAELGNTLLERDVDVEPRIERALAVRGGEPTALAAQEEPLVAEPDASAVAHLARDCAPRADWSRRVLDAHEEGYAYVGCAVEPTGSLLRRRSVARDLEPWRPGGGRNPRFAHPLVCPSVVNGVEPAWTDDVVGLPALVPPSDRRYGEPWIYDARIVVDARV